MSYHDKYIKYKMKYKKLQAQIGGEISIDDITGYPHKTEVFHTVDYDSGNTTSERVSNDTKNEGMIVPLILEIDGIIEDQKTKQINYTRLDKMNAIIENNKLMNDLLEKLIDKYRYHEVAKFIIYNLILKYSINSKLIKKISDTGKLRNYLINVISKYCVMIEKPFSTKVPDNSFQYKLFIKYNLHLINFLLKDEIINSGLINIILRNIEWVNIYLNSHIYSTLIDGITNNGNINIIDDYFIKNSNDPIMIEMFINKIPTDILNDKVQSILCNITTSIKGNKDFFEKLHNNLKEKNKDISDLILLYANKTIRNPIILNENKTMDNFIFKDKKHRFRMNNGTTMFLGRPKHKNITLEDLEKDYLTGPFIINP